MTPGKRVFDLVLASIGIAVLLPLMAIVGLAVKLEDRGPVLFRQSRVGWKGRPFTLLKFRSMTPGAERRGPAVTARGDSRVTKVGRLLRGSKLDELPQLWNVLRGEMSLVGPRPEVAKYVSRYDAGQRRVLELVPGITDPASIAYRHEERILGAAENPEAEYLEKVMPAKIALNLEYARSRTLLTDIAVIARTLRCIWAGE